MLFLCYNWGHHMNSLRNLSLCLSNEAQSDERGIEVLPRRVGPGPSRERSQFLGQGPRGHR